MPAVSYRSKPASRAPPSAPRAAERERRHSERHPPDLIRAVGVSGLTVEVPDGRLRAAREHKDRRYAQLPDLDQAARRLRAAVLVLLDPPAGGVEELWRAIGHHVSRSELEQTVATVHQLASQPDAADSQGTAFRGELLRRYQSLRRFLRALLEMVSFDAAPAGQPVLSALESLRALEGRPAASAPARCHSRS